MKDYKFILRTTLGHMDFMKLVSYLEKSPVDIQIEYEELYEYTDEA